MTMAFTIPSDGELRRLFDLLTKEDIEEMTKQYEEDVARAKKRLSKQNDS